ncbi:hypothetical protein M404DRAFT_27564 [Pisolithus tinctorius Marx 270]|uniref:Zn(2)-C6 fungal-type domain-containing protein n=1 Tax=Pisolithus tinctorius Marx 270 TaxID=870435 RepID=A0A0C3P6F8_PISTI|nr:hypothetical protein M404DRAFT_27564 [Pisolithus tinctorius Marx 270]
MSKSRPITMTDKNDEGWVVVDWTQVSDDAIRYDTDDEEEVMKAKSKERKRRKRVEREKIEAKRAEKEKAEAEKAVQEAEERRACEEEERQEAKHRCKAEAGGEVKKVVMDPGCTHCTRAQVVCEFVIDGNKKHMACVHCNLSKGKCRWPRDGKDTEASPKAGRTDEGKKRKAEDENTEARPSNQKWARTSARPTEVLDLDELKAGGSGMKEASVARYLGLENKLKRLIEAAGLIANNLASLFELHETMVKNLGCIANVLESILDESYSFGMAVSPLDSGSSELDSDELREEAKWLKNHSEDEEEESEGEDESMAEAK